MIESMRANLSKAFILLLLTFAAVIFINVFENSSKLDNTIQDALAATGDSVTDPNYSKENFEISVEDANIMDFSTAPNNVNDGTGNFTIEYIDQNDSEKNDPTNSAHWQYASETTHYTWSNYNATGGTGGVQSIDLTLNKLTGKEIIYRVKIKDLASNAFEQYYVIDDIAPSLSIEQEIFLSVTKRTIEKASLNANQQKYETTIGNTANNVPIPTITEKNIAKVDVKVSQFGGTMTTTSLTGPTNALFEGSLETVFENLLGEGGYIQIIITDKAGNEDIFDLFYDNKAPTLTTSTDQNNREIVSGVASGYRIETSANDGFTYYFTTSNDSYSATAGVINKEVVYFDIPLSQLSSVGTADIDIAVADMYGNRAASRSYITLDEAAPELSNVSLTSNNSTNGVDNEDLARGGDVVTLTFTSTEELYNLGVYILDRIATCDVEPPVEPSVNYTYTCIMPISEKDTDGTLTFVIYYEDEFGNEGATSTTDDSSSVTIDNTKPAITTSDLVTNTDVTITSSTEFLYYKIGNGDWVSIMTSATSYAIPIASLTEGENIIYLMDAAGNISSKPIKVTKDTTAPTITTVTIESNNASDSSFAQIGDVITIIFTMSEASSTLPTVSIQSGGTDVTGTAPVVTQDSTDTKKYTVTYTVVATDVEGVITFTISATDGLNSVTATQTTDSTSVTIDNTTPTIDTTQGSGNVTITSNNTNAATFALDGNTITLTFKSSEELKNIIVTIAGTTATVSEGTDNGDGTWTYVATIVVDGESDGAVSITIDATDLVGKSLTQVTTITDGSVTIDNTAPIISLKPADEDGILHDLDIVNYGVQATASNGTISLITKDGQEIDLSLVENKATEEGVYVVTATDTAGNVTTATFTIDKTLPVITLTEAVGGVVVNDDDVTKENVKITAEDNVSWATLTIQEENDEQPTGINNGHIVMTPGTYTIVLTDEAGNIATKTFTIDRTAPVLTLTEAITDGREVNDNGITNQNVKIALNEGTYTITKNGTEITDPLTDNTATEEGVYVITATDTAGNETIKTFTIDKTAPVITVKTTESTPVELNNNDITNKEVEITFTKNNATTSLTKNGGSGVVISSGHTVSEEGVYVVSSIDTAGNVADTFTFTIDKTAPVITLTEAITDGREVNDNGITNQNVKIALNEGTYTITKGGSATTLTDNTATEEGVYVVTATDTAGNVTTKTFTIDKTAPEIKLIENTGEGAGVTEVANGGSTKENVKITAVDSVSWDRLTIQEENASQETVINNNYVVIIEGTYTVKLKDTAGSETTITFTIDKTLPVITLTEAITDGIEVNDNGTTNQNVKVTLNEGSYTITKDGSTITLTDDIATEEGVYVVTATDTAGNVSTVTFTIDRTAPTIKVETTETTPVSVVGGTTNQNVKITVADTDLESLIISRGGVNIIISSGYIAEVEGVYTVTAEDEAGNISTASFTIDKTAPVITLKAYDKDTVTDLIGDLSDNGITNQNVEVTSDNATDTIVVTDADSNTVTLDTNNQVTTAGIYTVTVTDEAGNVTTATFTIDRTAPVITLTETTGALGTVTASGATKENVKIEVTETNLSEVKLQKTGETEVIISSGYIAIAEGEYTVTVTDMAGNTTVETFTIDKTDPVIILKEYKQDPVTDLIGDLSDNGVTNQNVEVTSDNATDTIVVTDADSNTVTLDTNNQVTVAGVYTVTVTDAVGNETIATFTIDRTAPTIEVKTTEATPVTVNDGETTNQNVKITISETTTTTTTTTTTISKDGSVAATITSGYIVDSEGTYVVTSIDEAGNEATFTFTIDKTAPTATITEFNTNNTYNTSYATTGDEIKLVVEFSETVSSPSFVLKYGDGTEITVDSTTNVGNTYTIIYTVTTTSVNGLVSFTVNANDSIGNSIAQVTEADTTSFVQIDNTKPVLSIETEGTTTSTNTTGAFKIISDHIFTQYKINQGNWITVSETKDYTVVVPFGTNTITVMDLAGNVSNEVTAIVDSSSGIVIIVDGSSVNNTGDFTFITNVEAETVEKSTDGGTTWETVTVDQAILATLTFDLSGLTTGVTLIRVTDLDTTTSDTAEVMYDATAPTIDNISIVGNNTNDTTKVKAGDTVTLTFDSTEELFYVSIKIAGKEIGFLDITETYNDTEGKWQYEATYKVVLSDVDGAVTYEILATDIADNEASISAVATSLDIDNTAPEITLETDETTPSTITDGQYTNQNVVISSDGQNDTLTITLNGSPVTLTDNKATEEGAYIVTSVDEVGNVTEVTFTIDKTTPTLSLSTESKTVSNGDAVNEDVTVTASDQNLKELVVTKDGLTTTIQSGHVITAEGVYTVTVTDMAGNTTVKTFTIDKTAPVLTSNVYISQGGVFEISSNEEFTEYSIDGGTTWEPVTAGTTHSYDVSAEANGEYTFQVKGIAGNTSNEITLIYDSTAPSITLTTASETITNNGVTNKNVTVTASDTLTNIVSIYLERSDGTRAYIQNGYIAITEGTYTITATDEAGNETTIVFTVDKTKPNIILTELDADNANQEMGLLLNNGVTKENVQIGSNDTNVTYTITKDTVELTEALIDNIATEAGVYTVKAEDVAGNISSTLTFTIDRTPPTLIIKDQASGEVFTGNITNKNLIGEVSDNVEVSYIRVEISDGTDMIITSAYVATKEGDYTVTVVDTAGNSTIRTFTIDKTAPVITLEAYDKDAETPTLIGVLSDNGVTNQNVKVTSNNATDTIVVTDADSNTVTLDTNNQVTVAGVYTVTVTDEAGNETIATFTIDRTPPTVVIKEQTSGEEISSGSVSSDNIVGEVSDASGIASIRIIISDGTDMIITSEYVARTEGSYQVIVTDNAGNATEVTFTIDRTAPVLTSNTMINNTGSFVITSTESFTEYSVDGGTTWETTTAGTEFTYDVTASGEGTYTFQVRDTAENTSNVLTLIYDTTVPVFNVTSEDGTLTVSEGDIINYDVKISASDTNLVSVVLEITLENGGVSGGNITNNMPFLTVFSGVYKATATDAAGNQTVLNFTIDKTAPVITSDTMINNTGSFVITSTESFTEYSVDGGTTWETTTEGTEFTYDVTSSGEGSYKFQVKDAAGNLSNELSLIYDATAPTVTFTKETSQTTIDDGGISNETIIVTFSDNLTGIAETLIKRDDGSEASVSSGFKAMVAGLYTIKLVDGAGNTTTQTFTIDKTAPVITSNTMINNTGSFEITSTESFTEYSIDGGTTWETTTAGTTFPYDVTESGEGTHKFQVKDAAGNISNELELIYDITKVTIDLENANTNETLSEGAITFNDVIISWDTTDSSLDNILMEVFNDNVLSLSTNINNGNSTGEFNANLEGDYKITATDKAGNVTIVTFTIDQTAPIVLLTEFDGTTNLGEIEYDSATSNNVEVTTEDATDTIKITNENNEEVSLDENNQITTEGTYTVEVTDLAGNVTKVGFIIDRTDPVIEITIDGTSEAVLNGDVVNQHIVVNVTDNSAVAYVYIEVTLEDGTGNGAEITDVLPFKTILAGEYTVIVRDIAGNEISTNFIIDQTAPVIEAVDQVIDSGAFEITSNEVFTEYTTDGGTTWQTMTEGTTYNYNVSGVEGIYTFQVKDKAGNISNELRLVFDSTAPEIILTNIGTQEILENGAVTYGTVRVSWSDSNIEKVHLSRTSFEGIEASGYIDSAPYYDTSVSGVYTVVATDAAGKETTKTFTVDNTEVTVETVSIESNNDNTAFAKTGNVITITFTVGQTLQIEPTVSMKTGGNDVTGTDLTITQDETETTKYTVTYTVVETDTEGQVTFIITVSNQARGIQVTKTTDETKVTIDNTAPTIEANETINNTGAFTITSTTGTFEWYSTDNGATWTNVNETTKTNIIGLETGTYQIQVKDSVGHLSNVLTLTVDRSQTDLILNITSEAINNTGTYTFETNQNIIEVYISTDNTTWTLLDTVDFSAGVKAFTLTDLTNETTYIKVKNALGLESNIVEVKYDNTNPVIDTTEGSNNVVIESNNADKTLAVNGDTITLTFIASEQLTNIEVTIANTTATVNEGVENTDGTWTYTATLVVNNQANGTAEITIDAADIAGNTLTQITQTTNGSSVIIDNTVPVIDTTQNSGNVAIESNNADKTLAVNGDTIILTFKVSEQLTSIVVTIANTRATVNEGVENTDGTWTYTATLVVNNQANGEVSITIDGTDKSGNILEQVTTITDGKVIIDNALVVEAEKVNVKINPSDLPLIFTVGAETPDWTKYFEATIGENTITIDSSMISTNVDMAKAGTYAITLTINDSNGNELSETSLNVKVIEEETKTEKDDDNLIFGILNPDDTLEVSLIILIILTTLMAIMVVKRATTIKES